MQRGAAGTLVWTLSRSRSRSLSLSRARVLGDSGTSLNNECRRSARSPENVSVWFSTNVQRRAILLVWSFNGRKTVNMWIPTEHEKFGVGKFLRVIFDSGVKCAWARSGASFSECVQLFPRLSLEKKSNAQLVRGWTRFCLCNSAPKCSLFSKNVRSVSYTF